MPIYKIVFPAIAISIILRQIYFLIKWEKWWREVLFRFIFWFYFWLLALFPETIDIFAKITWIQDSVRAFFASIIMLLFFMIVNMFLIIEKINRDLTKIVRNIAIKDWKNNMKKNGEI